MRGSQEGWSGIFRKYTPGSVDVHGCAECAVYEDTIRNILVQFSPESTWWPENGTWAVATHKRGYGS